MSTKFTIPKKPLRERITNFAQSLLFWRGRRKGMIHTSNITWENLRVVFWPRTFSERYGYLGAIPWKEDGKLFKAMEPLVIFMDYKARPSWCPRWVLRFLHLFGSDNSIIRVRNWRLHNLEKRLTKGYSIWDYKTKWTEYDLRISVVGDEQISELAGDIEKAFYEKGYRESLVEAIRKIQPDFKKTWMNIDSLEEYLEELKSDSFANPI